MLSISQCGQSSAQNLSNNFQFVQSCIVDDEAAGLDSYNGHLPSLTYIPVTRGLEKDPVNWFMPSQGYDSTKGTHQVLKLQPFASGGYEVLITTQDLERVARLMDMDRKQGKREKGEQKENDVISSQQRSKATVRKRIKSMGLECLLTLSIRENDPDTYRNVEEWGVLWDKFVRMCKRHGVDFEYVAVLEKHKKGNFHLHAAITTNLNHKLIRRFWYMCLGGKGNEKGAFTPGNIDLSYKYHMTAHKRRAGVARYVSKYITKQSGHVEFNKKRYWSTKHKLPDVKRYILKSDGLLDGLKEACELLGLDFLRVVGASKQFEIYRDGLASMGAWFSYDDDLASSVPF